METVVLIPLALHLVLTVILMFRRGLGWPVRILMFFLLAFHFAWWSKEISILISLVPQMQAEQWLIAAEQSVEAGLLGLLWLWPVTLFYVLFAASDADSKMNIMILSVLTLIFFASYFLLRLPSIVSS